VFENHEIIISLIANDCIISYFSLDFPYLFRSLRIVYVIDRDRKSQDISLIFIIWYYDLRWSVVDVNALNIQLLKNPSFENSTKSLTGWTLWCSTSCGGSGEELYTTSQCHLSTGTCFGANCPGSTAIIFLSQSFSTVIGHIYTISYWLIASGGGGRTNNQNNFYVDVN
jgi:hypothetical protein